MTSTSSSSKSTETSQDVEDPPSDLESDYEDISSGASSVDLKKSDEATPESETSDSGSIVKDLEEPGTEVGTDYEDYKVGEGYYVASATSDKYHRPDCSYAKKIKSENRIIFSDVWEAREAGYSPCKVCNPE